MRHLRRLAVSRENLKRLNLQGVGTFLSFQSDDAAEGLQFVGAEACTVPFVIDVREGVLELSLDGESVGTVLDWANLRVALPATGEVLIACSVENVEVGEMSEFLSQGSPLAGCPAQR